MSIDLPVELRPSRRRRLVVGPCGVGAPTGRPPQLRTLASTARVLQHRVGPRLQLGLRGRSNPSRLSQSCPLNRLLLPRLRYLVTNQSCPPLLSQLWRPFRRVDR